MGDENLDITPRLKIMGVPGISPDSSIHGEGSFPGMA
jgi:hypothetical protein